MSNRPRGEQLTVQQRCLLEGEKDESDRKIYSRFCLLLANLRRGTSFKSPMRVENENIGK
jgi:hypothetical protein